MTCINLDVTTRLERYGRSVTDAQRYKATRYVASNARDAHDLTLLLDMLGLTAHDGMEKK